MGANGRSAGTHNAARTVYERWRSGQSHGRRVKGETHYGVQLRPRFPGDLHQSIAQCMNPFGPFVLMLLCLRGNSRGQYV